MSPTILTGDVNQRILGSLSKIRRKITKYMLACI